MTLTELERAVVDEISRREEELVELASRLIAFDTRTHTPGDPPRDEAALQGYLVERLRARGAETELVEPPSDMIADHWMTSSDFDGFRGRPQLVGRFAGTGGGRTLLLNGHVDVVDVAPAEEWSVDPFTAEVRDRTLFGRGACDMKGGIASMVLAAEVLAEHAPPLAGDLVVNTVTDEESTGLGGLAMARLLRADGGIVPEPSGLHVLVACRGSLLLAVDVSGRAGHAGTSPRHHTDGGAVNAIEKAAYLIESIQRLRDDWRLRYRHPYLAPPDIVPTAIAGGEWMVSYPARCRIDCHVEYLPQQADESGRGGIAMGEIESWIAAAAAADPWLATHPPTVRWLPGEVPPAEVAEDEPVVSTLLETAQALGRPSRLGGMDNWHDGASLILEGGIPTVCFGPGELAVAHTVDEHVSIDDLVACAQALAVTALRFCNGSPRA